MTVRALFDALVDLPADQREAYLGSHCDDEARRLEVRQLLRSHEQVDATFLQPIRWRREDATHDRVGQTAGAYTLVEPIARGGMSTVYLGRRSDGRYEADVAIKVLNAGSGITAAQIDQERRALASLQHPNITMLLDAGELASGEPYLVMELVEGTRLDEYCREHALAPREVVRLFLQVCAAVDAAHRSAILHRDLKPSNILVSPGGNVKLLDFGVSRSLATSGHTLPYGQWLTPEYASPEQAAGVPLRTGSDVYSLGVVLFELLTGTLPYGDPVAHPLQLAKAITEGRTRRAREARPDLDRDLDLILAKALHRVATDRYASVEQLKTDLESYLHGRPVQARAGGSLYRLRRFVQRNRVVAAAAVLVMGIVAVAVLVALERGRTARVQNDAYRSLLYAAEIRLAQDALEEGRLDDMRALLARQAPRTGEQDTRGAEWHVLHDLATTTEVVKRTSSVVNRIAMSPADGAVATAGSDGAIHLWRQSVDAPTLIGTHTGKTWGVAFSPDGRRLASGGTDGDLREWDLGATRMHTRVPLGASVHAVAYAPDGRTLAAGLYTGLIQEVDVPGHRAPRTLGDMRVPVSDVAYSPDGRWLAAAFEAPRVAVWDRHHPGRVRMLPTSGEYTTSVAFSPQSERLVGTTRDGSVLTWRVDTGARVHDDRVFEGMLESIAMTPDGRSVIAGHGAWISRWRASDWRLESRIAAHAGRVMSLAVSHDGTRLVSAGSDQSLKFRSLVEPDRRQLLHGDEVWGIAFSPADGRMATAGSDGRVVVWTSTGDTMADVNVNGNRARAAAFSPDGRWLASGHGDSTIRLWDPATLRPGPVLQGHSNQVRQVIFSADGRLLAAASEDGTASVWDVDRRRLVRQVRHRDRVRGVAFLRGSDLLVTGSDDKTLGVWRIETGERLATMEGHTAPLHGLSVSSNGRLIASAGADATVRLWDAVTYKAIRTLSGHADRVWSVSFSPDGSRLASASSDDTVRLWEPATGREMLALRSPGAHRAVAWSPDGSRLAASGSEMVSVWNAAQ